MQREDPDIECRRPSPVSCLVRSFICSAERLWRSACFLRGVPRLLRPLGLRLRRNIPYTYGCERIAPAGRLERYLDAEILE